MGRYRIISELTSDYAYAFRIEPDGRAVAEWVNQAFVRTIGYTAAEIDAAPGGWLGLVHPDDAERVRAHARRLLAGASDASEYRVVTAGGEVRWLRAYARPVRDRAGRLVRIYGAAHDVTERVRAEAERATLLDHAEQARAEAERARGYFAFLAEASNLLGASLDHATTLANVSRLVVSHLADCCAVYLLEPDGAAGLAALTHADPARQAWADALQRRHVEPAPQLLRVLRNGLPLLYPEIDHARLAAAVADPEILAVACEFHSALCVPLAARGRVLGALWLASSRPGRRYGPADLALAEDLARRAALAVDNARLYRDAQDADRRKDEFLALLGHELRNPLAAVAGAVQLLEETGSRRLAPIRHRAIIARQVRNLARLVDDLLDVSRITSGKIALARQPLDLAALAWRCVEMQTPGGPAVSLRTPHEPIVVDGDPVRLEQVLGNLLDNARKYTPAGGHVRVIVERDGAHARLVVEDDGIGIAPEVLPRIFEPFAQAGAPVGQRQGGLGLGLTLVQRLVEQHGGTVGAASDGPGRGSRFVVTLPRTEGVPVDQAPAPAPAQSPSPRRILLVEDNRDAREALRALLEVWGHRVETAADGPSGLAAALADPPEVALVDVGLPGLDGHELARRLRAAPGGAGVFLVALTGYGQPEDERLALAAGFDVHVVKPVEPAELVRLLARPPARAAPRQPSAAARSGSSSR